MYLVHSQRTHVASKEHTCSRCSRPIEPGETYTRVFEIPKDTFEISVYKLHHPIENPCPSRSTERQAGYGKGWSRSD